jgi:hypothetical protein
MQKARGQDTYVPPTACKYTVSGSISPPYSGYFAPFLHSTGSLSVTQSYLALPDGAGSFTQGASDPVLRPTFPGSSASLSSSLTPVLQPPSRRNGLGLGSSAFARHYLRNHVCFLFLHLLRCFSSVRWLLDCSRSYGCTIRGCPIRTSWDRCVFAAPPSFSQLTTSFFAAECQGILRIPFLRSM